PGEEARRAGGRGEGELADVVREVARRFQARGEARRPVHRHVLGTQPHLDRAVAARLGLAGEHAVLRAVALGEAGRIGTQRMDLALDELHLAGAAGARVALVGEAQARAQSRAQQRIVLGAGKRLAARDADFAHQSAIIALASLGMNPRRREMFSAAATTDGMVACTCFLLMRCTGAATLIAATTRALWSRMGAATQRSPTSISSSSIA